jgi:fumarylacetoacetase
MRGKSPPLTRLGLWPIHPLPQGERGNGSPNLPNLNATHDPSRKSWITSANTPETDFPIQNLPYGIFSTPGTAPRAGIAIGDQVLDLAVLEAEGLLTPSPGNPVFSQPILNTFMALGPKVWSTTRETVSNLLETSAQALQNDTKLRSRALFSQDSVTLHLPMFVRSFTDFYASREHATNVGSMFRDPENALMPNWLHVPIGYNGRASTVVVSGTPIHRPLGQLKPPGADTPILAPCRKLDLELELGAIVGTPSRMGEPVTVSKAYDMIFGYCLLNDWSARDIQVWEYQPLGPFQAKAFATTISPWIVTREALEPFRRPTPPRERPLLPYLTETQHNNFDLNLQVDLAAAGQRATIARTNSRNMYYSAAQQLAHHAVGGCAMETGDLLGSGTISGNEKNSYGSLLELTWNGQNPITLPDGSTRQFLEDGDSIEITGWAQGDGHRIGFSRCAGTILPAPQEPDWTK